MLFVREVISWYRCKFDDLDYFVDIFAIFYWLDIAMGSKPNSIILILSYGVVFKAQIKKKKKRKKLHSENICGFQLIMTQICSHVDFMWIFN